MSAPVATGPAGAPAIREAQVVAAMQFLSKSARRHCERASERPRQKTDRQHFVACHSLSSLLSPFFVLQSQGGE